MKKESGELEYYIVIPKDRLKEAYQHAPSKEKKIMEAVLQKMPSGSYAMTGEMMYVNPHRIHREGNKKVVNSYDGVLGNINIITDTVPVFSFVGIFLVREHDTETLFEME